MPVAVAAVGQEEVLAQQVQDQPLRELVLILQVLVLEMVRQHPKTEVAEAEVKEMLVLQAQEVLAAKES
jgi:hypothetical protein